MKLALFSSDYIKQTSIELMTALNIEQASRNKHENILVASSEPKLSDVDCVRLL